MRAISGFLLLSLAAACGGDDDGGGASNTSDGGTSTATCSVTVSLEDFKFVPAMVNLSSGASTVCVKNNGKSPHDYVVRDADKKRLGGTSMLDPGESEQLKITLQAGSYTSYCSVAGHEALGMVGTVTVK